MGESDKPFSGHECARFLPVLLIGARVGLGDVRRPVGGDHLIRSDLQSRPLPAHFTADLSKRYSLVRIRQQR